MPRRTRARFKEDDDSRILAAISYVLGIFAIVLYLVKKDDEYVKDHSINAIAWGIWVIVGWIVMLIIASILSIIPFIGFALSAILWALFDLGVLVILVILAIKAYNGEMIHIPLYNAVRNAIENL